MTRIDVRGVSERGSATIEAVIILPALMFFAGLVLAAGRTAITHQSVEVAAADSVRSASLARSPGQAQADAGAAASAALVGRRLHCRTLSVVIDTADLSAPTGVAGQVTARVSCVVDLSDVAVPGMPGSIMINSVATSPLDQYRERHP